MANRQADRKQAGNKSRYENIDEEEYSDSSNQGDDFISNFDEEASSSGDDERESSFYSGSKSALYDSNGLSLSKSTHRELNSYHIEMPGEYWQILKYLKFIKVILIEFFWFAVTYFMCRDRVSNIGMKSRESG